MLFNSIEYLVFLPAVVCLYFLSPVRLRWALLLAASYLFYAAWNIAYVALIGASTLADYVAALGMGREPDRRGRRKWLALSLTVNLGLLFTFKYANFAIDSLQMASDGLGIGVDLPTLNVLLPIGISFYTFQTLSYAIDVYRGDREPERHLGKFAVFVAFFPQLVAGPIERAKRLLPQFSEHHRWDTDRVKEGVQRILWGFFKKLVVADQAGLYVDAVFADPAEHGTVTLVLGTWLFAFQVYCDFSGYSDIAIGSARIMGFRLMENFRRPYAGETLADLWRRWHISLTTWFRDYIYFPLGGSRAGIARWAIATGAVFMVSGVWHGAAWTFVFWGGLHVLYAWCARATGGLRRRMVDRLPGWCQPALRPIRVFYIFNIWSFSLIFFRSQTIQDAFDYVEGIFGRFHWSAEALLNGFSPVEWTVIAVAPLILMLLEFFQGDRGIVAFLATLSFPVRALLLAFLFFATVVLGPMDSHQFVYFQF